MQQITARTLRGVTWKKVYEYAGGTVSFKTYACDELPGFTITKTIRKRVRGQHTTISTYKVHGRKTESPTQAVRYWNEHVKARKAAELGTGHAPAGSAKSAGPQGQRKPRL